MLWTHIYLATLFCSLLFISGTASAGNLYTGKFDPVSVYSIYPPLKKNASADDAFATGDVFEGNYAMAAPASRPWRIAFLFPHIKDSYWIGASYGVITEARRLGVAVDIFPAEGYVDLIGQLRKMDEVIAKKYDAIVISPISLTSNNASIAKARARGIPVFELANDSSSDDLTIKVTTSLKEMGAEAMKWVIRDAQLRGLKQINIALLPGPADAGWVRGEVAGTLETAHHASLKINIVDIKYGDSDLVGQSILAAQLIAEHGKKLDYILGCSGCAPAVILPVKMAGLAGKVRVVAYDLTRDVAEQLRSGKIDAAVDTKAVSQSRVVIDAAVNFLEGRIKKPPHTILIKLGLVDHTNFESYDYDISIAPAGYLTELSYTPEKSGRVMAR